MSALYLKHMAGYGQKILQEDPECINASSDVGESQLGSCSDTQSY